MLYLRLLAILFVVSGCSMLFGPSTFDPSFHPGYSPGFGGAKIPIPAKGILDGNFGTAGVMSVPVYNLLDHGYGVVLQTDGKMVEVGESNDGTYTKFALMRFNTNGSLDAAYATAGLQSLQIGPFDSGAKSAVLQPDGKVVAVGYAKGGGAVQDFGLARFNVDGSLDTTFGTSGAVRHFMTVGNDHARSAVLQSDGKIIAIGYANGSGYGVARFSANGVIDGTFGTAGITVVNPTANFNRPEAAVLQTDGSVVVVGDVDANGAGDYRVAAMRFTSAGALDAAYGTSGKTLVDVGGAGKGRGAAAVLQSSGKTVVVATMWNGSGFAALRFSTAGALDNTFGTNGMIIVDMFGGYNQYSQAAALQQDQAIVAAGFYYDTTYNHFAVARFSSDGKIDTTFGTAGSISIPIGPANSRAYSAAIEADGGIIVGGDTTPPCCGSTGTFSLARFR